MTEPAPWKRNPTVLFIAATTLATITGTTSATLIALTIVHESEPRALTCTCETPPMEPDGPDCEPDSSEPSSSLAPTTAPKPARSTVDRRPADDDSEPVVQGRLEKAVIREVVRENIDDIRGCYNEGLARDSQLGGRVSVRFVIDPDGDVPVAVVASSTLPDSEVSNCAAKAVKRWTFPGPSDGGNVVVTYPFVLQPG